MFPVPPLPERIGVYRVLRRLPSPGGADVYLGREEGPLGFTREVVLKLATGAADLAAEELAREANAVAQLNHPAILRMYSFFEHDGRIVLVLEHVEGTSLARIIAANRRRRQRLPDPSVFHVAHRLVSALAHAHGEPGGRSPVIHRAVSPAALHVGWDGSVRLSGFGLAKIVGSSPDTAVGLVKGVTGYMAPEQLRGERVTERVDIYQAGLVIWEMLSGEPPPGGPQKSREAELVQMMAGERLPSVAVLRPSLPREIVAVLDAALEPNVDKRGITAGEIERWLAKTVDVERGREELRERAVALRSTTAREVSPQPEAQRQSLGGVRTSTRKNAPRFPGVATRVTGRPSADEAPPPSRPPPPGRTSPPVSRSARPPPRADSVVPSVRTPGQRVSNVPAPGGVATGTSARLPTAPPGSAQKTAPPPNVQKGTLIGLAAPRPASFPDIVPGGAMEPAPISRAALPPPSIPLPPAMMAGHGLPTSVSGIAVGGSGTEPEVAGRAEDTLMMRRGGGRAWAPVILVVAGVVSLLGAAIVLLIALRRPQPAPIVAPIAAPPAASAPPVPPPPPPTASAVPPSERPEVVIPPKHGALIVQSPAPGSVYLNGRPIGETGPQPIVTPCGRRYVRVGAPPEPGRQVTWLTKGVSAVVVCGTTTTIEVPPLPLTRVK